MFNCPWSLCFSQFHDRLFVCDYNNRRIRIIDVKTGIIAILNHFLIIKGNVSSIGNGTPGHIDGTAEQAQFFNLSGITCSESDGSLLVCDSGSHNIRKITFEGKAVLQFYCIQQAY